MPKTPMPHVENESTSHAAQPTADGPPAHANKDKYTNSGYPAGGDQTQAGRDEYGRDAAQRAQAEHLPTDGGTRPPEPPPDVQDASAHREK